MKAQLAVIVIAALVLIVNHAHAQRWTTAHPISGQANRHVSGQARQFPSSKDIYQSYSQGHQSYPNPDRGPCPTPVPSWVNAN